MKSRGRIDSESVSAAHLRGLNLDRILNVAMSRTGRFTRAELIEATKLSAPTVGTLSSQLIERGLLRDLGTGPSSGGRRPAYMEFNARHGYVAGIDLGPTTTRLAVADLRGEAVAHRVMPTPSGVGPAKLLERLAASLQTMLAEEHVPVERLRIVAAGAPGVVDRKRGVVVALAPNLKGWSGVPMGRILGDALGVPVVVENDVNLAVMAERWRGAARGHDTCAFVSVDTGIGAGIVIDGELHHGHHGMAGEIAIMCMGPQYAERDFGSRGCLETLAGLKAVKARWSRGARGASPRWLGELFAASRNGDSEARAVVKETATLISLAVVNVCVVIDPSLVVLGGALLGEQSALVEEVRRIVGRIVPTPSAIVVSALGEEAPLWGSLLLARTEAAQRIRRQLRQGLTRAAS